MSAESGDIQMPGDTSFGVLPQELIIRESQKLLPEALTAFAELQVLEKKLEKVQHELETRDDYESESYHKILDELSHLNDRIHHMDGANAEVHARKVLKGLGFLDTDMDRELSEFSGGWQMRVELAKLLLKKPDYLLLDEPTNHLDIEAILWIEKFLQDYQGAVIVISHDKTFLDNITKRTLHIENGRLYDYATNYSGYRIEKVERMKILRSQYENQQKDLAQKQKLVEKFRAKANKAKMAQSMIKQIDRIERIELVDEDSRGINVNFLPAAREGSVVFAARGLSKNFDQLKVLQDIDIHIDRGEKIAFVGQNGQGKTTLSKIIAGALEAEKGEISYGHNIQLGYYAQDQSEKLQKDMTVLENMESHAPRELFPRVRSILGAFLFSGDDVDKKVSVLSGGEKARLALSLLLLRPVNLLILDEPTNHLDIPTKEILKNALNRYSGTMIVVSHDRDFLHGLTDRTIEFRDKQLNEYIGDINDFLAKRQVDQMRSLSARSVENNSPEEKSKNQSYKDGKKLKSLENKIIKMEKGIANMETEMADPAFYERADMNDSLQKYEQQKEELQQLYDQLEELM
jgi:ATP-binding cassette subfamily F protein 3